MTHRWNFHAKNARTAARSPPPSAPTRTSRGNAIRMPLSVNAGSDGPGSLMVAYKRTHRKRTRTQHGRARGATPWHCGDHCIGTPPPSFGHLPPHMWTKGGYSTNADARSATAADRLASRRSWSGMAGGEGLGEGAYCQSSLALSYFFLWDPPGRMTKKHDAVRPRCANGAYKCQCCMRDASPSKRLG